MKLPYITVLWHEYHTDEEGQDRRFLAYLSYVSVFIHGLTFLGGPELWQVDIFGTTRHVIKSVPGPHVQLRQWLVCAVVVTGVVMCGLRAWRVFSNHRSNLGQEKRGGKELTSWLAFIHLETCLMVLLIGSAYLTSSKWTAPKHTLTSAARASASNPTQLNSDLLDSGATAALMASHVGNNREASRLTEKLPHTAGSTPEASRCWLVQLAVGCVYVLMAFELKLAHLARAPFIPALTPKFILALGVLNAWFRLLHDLFLQFLVAALQLALCGSAIVTVTGQLRRCRQNKRDF